MDWSFLDYLWIIVMFFSHSDGTHSLVSRRHNATFLQICSDEERNSHLAWPEREYIFSIVPFGVNFGQIRD